MSVAEAFRSRLIKARSAIGWSQAQLAEVSGVAAAQVSRYESGRNEPRPAVVARLARALNVNFDWLMFGVGHPENDSSDRVEPPEGWTSIEADVPEQLHRYLNGLAERRGVTIEALVKQILDDAMMRDSDRKR
jgi:transcriptional regulator with XRE-family HTH domain